MVFGGNFTGAVTHLGGTGDDTLAGTAVAETFVGGTGNNTLIGNGGTDAFQGGAGNGVMRVSSLTLRRLSGSPRWTSVSMRGQLSEVKPTDLDLAPMPQSDPTRTRTVTRHRPKSPLHGPIPDTEL